MTHLQAALGLAQLEQLDRNLERKREMGRRYDALLADIPGLQRPLPRTDFADNLYWVYGVVLDEAVAFEVQWYAQGLASQSKAAELAALTRGDFLDELYRRKVPACQVTADELTDEIHGA